MNGNRVSYRSMNITNTTISHHKLYTDSSFCSHLSVFTSVDELIPHLCFKKLQCMLRCHNLRIFQSRSCRSLQFNMQCFLLFPITYTSEGRAIAIAFLLFFAKLDTAIRDGDYHNPFCVACQDCL